MIIKNLNPNDILEISKLLAYRHKEERLKYPELNKIFENENLLKSILLKKFNQKMTIAIGAYQDNKLLGFIISNIKTDPVFGRCAWVKYDGLAIAEDVNPSIYRNLYAHISDIWLKLGCLKHFVILPGSRTDVINSWLNSGFAYEQVFGIKKLESKKINSLKDITIRKAMFKDKSDLESISGLIMSFQAQSPTYAVALPEMFQEIKNGYGRLVSDSDAHVLLAYKNDEFLGFTCGYFEDEDKENMIIPFKSTELAVAGTNSSYQNKGIGTLLTHSLFEDSINAGYKNSTTDWRITNMKSSIFWPKMGYKPYAYRFVRTIDQRIYWANGYSKL